jgi:predicted metal-dependent HD superfamily phosphohydrolase
MLRDDIYGELVNAYTAPDRHYHDIRHIAHCLSELDGVRHLAHNPQAIEVAIWFHDVVYDGRLKDNEEQSADVAAAALKRLGASDVFIGEVQQLILFTRHDVEPSTSDGKLMADIDLASLALAPDRFDENSRRIRSEYLHVPEDTFIRNRNNMLGGLLKRPRIYYTDVFRDRYEGQARENLERAVSGGAAVEQ